MCFKGYLLLFLLFFFFEHSSARRSPRLSIAPLSAVVLFFVCSFRIRVFSYFAVLWLVFLYLFRFVTFLLFFFSFSVELMNKMPEEENDVSEKDREPRDD